MDDNERNRQMRKNFWKGTLMGALIGAAAGILLAPKSGKETREDIKGKVKGSYKDIQHRLEKMSDEMNGRVESLKAVAKELQGEAKEESQELIRRADILKRDLRESATDLAKTGAQTKDVAVKQVKQLLAEGSSVMSELERVTKLLANSAKDKVTDAATGSGGEER